MTEAAFPLVSYFMKQRTLIPVWTLPLRHISSSLGVARPFTNKVEKGWKNVQTLWWAELDRLLVHTLQIRGGAQGIAGKTKQQENGLRGGGVKN